MSGGEWAFYLVPFAVTLLATSWYAAGLRRSPPPRTTKPRRHTLASSALTGGLAVILLSLGQMIDVKKGTVPLIGLAAGFSAAIFIHACISVFPRVTKHKVNGDAMELPVDKKRRRYVAS